MICNLSTSISNRHIHGTHTCMQVKYSYTLQKLKINKKEKSLISRFYLKQINQTTKTLNTKHTTNQATNKREKKKQKFLRRKSARGVGVLAAKPDNLSLIPRTHRVGDLVGCPLTFMCKLLKHVYGYIHVHVHIHKIMST